ncbi:hypothetical protein GGH96_005996, partial [Coemansia sp. RSA 1972]
RHIVVILKWIDGLLKSNELERHEYAYLLECKLKEAGKHPSQKVSEPSGTDVKEEEVKEEEVKEEEVKEEEVKEEEVKEEVKEEKVFDKSPMVDMSVIEDIEREIESLKKRR